LRNGMNLFGDGSKDECVPSKRRSRKSEENHET